MFWRRTICAGADGHGVERAGEAGCRCCRACFPDRWLLWLGLLFIASVYFFPTGIVGKLRGGPS